MLQQTLTVIVMSIVMVRSLPWYVMQTVALKIIVAVLITVIETVPGTVIVTVTCFGFKSMPS
jgi:hypothetical protein